MKKTITLSAICLTSVTFGTQGSEPIKDNGKPEYRYPHEKIIATNDESTVLFPEEFVFVELGTEADLEGEDRKAAFTKILIADADLEGSFKTRFGAWLYKAAHRGKIRQDRESRQWYVGRYTRAADGEAVYQRRFGWKGQNEPVDYGDKNPFTPWDIGIEWLSGTGNRTQYFKAGDSFTELYRKHKFVDLVRRKVMDQLSTSNGQNTEQDGMTHNLGGIQGLSRFVKDCLTLVTAGAIGNIVYTYLGSHRLNYRVARIDEENKAAEVTFIMYNTSTIESATRPPVIGYIPLWRNTIGKALNKRFKAGPMSETKQILNGLKQSIGKMKISMKKIATTFFIFLTALIVYAQEPVTFRGSNGKYGVKDAAGKEIIPAKYDDVSSKFSEGFAGVKVNNKWGYADLSSGKEITPVKYDRIGFFEDGLCLVLLNGKHGFIDKTGNEVIPLQYDRAGSFSESLASVMLNNKVGFIDRSGNEVIPIKYDDAGPFSEGRAIVSFNNKWGYIDKTGKEVIPIIFDAITKVENGILTVVENGRTYKIDKAGKEVQ